MNEWTIRAMRRIYEKASDGIVVEDGLIRYDWSGHTRQIAHLPYCHEGRYSAGYYALERLLTWVGAPDTEEEAGGRASGLARSRQAAEPSQAAFGAAVDRPGARISASAADPADRPGEAGLDTLRALAGLQITDPQSEFYGAFRWYAEEEEVQDSNAAFFILMPLVSLRLRVPEAVPAEHAAVTDEMLRHAAAWFERECREPELYYPNKTMSDGAMLLAAAGLLGDGARLNAAADYFERWESYTSRRGWGWGENMSLVYQSVMLNALEISVPLLKELRPELAERLAAHRETLLNILRFHDGRELVPSIRSYNFGGEVRRSSLAWLIAGVTGTEQAEETEFHVNDFSTLLLFDSAFRERGPQDGIGAEARRKDAADALPAPRVREERVFDGARAYSWIGRRTRLGSLNAFPVIPGSYQHENWGLGWQSFPLSAAAEEGQVSYARWYVDDGETVRTHPAESYKTAYLMPALFRQRPYPEVRTYAAQNGHALLALRVLENLRQPAAEIADEWIVHRYAGEAEEVAGGDGRTWHVLRYPGAAIAIAALQGIRFGEEEGKPASGSGGAEDGPQTKGSLAGNEPDASGERKLNPAERRPGTLRAEREEGRLKLRQLLYAGARRTLCAPRLETGWAVLCLDEAADEAAVRARLEQVTIEDSVLDDREMPRDPHERIRRIRLLEGGRERTALNIDPHGS
ncbi:hypothetical protein [Saccharibacillus alkalitolerans]|uniref:Heparinase II/III-like protein n=1 Tax=Saccharibacillus alkalitolerans TaxID=2705290 RepID=A0ABX0F2Y5_9BACL|nr:hypothetical protein [Saccharibacillus alkalitolerans]NGZ75352.1 hypothetical protein [Saccharibacillus alkalitolerans]